VYACGITPYDVTHLGHAATFVWVDALCRVLRAGGADVIMSRNVTDVDDALLAAASRAGAPYDEFAVIQQFYFDRDMAELGVGRPAIEPRAHAYVGQVIALAGGLMAKGAAYERGGGVYFRGGTFVRRTVADEPAARSGRRLTCRPAVLICGSRITRIRRPWRRRSLVCGRSRASGWA
jgi:cysteinyl-tRNA synthetase